MKPEQAEIDAAAPGSRQAEGGARHPKKSRGLLREGATVKFAFIAKHRGIWPAGWMCEALGVSRGGLLCLADAAAQCPRARATKMLTAKVRTSFLGSDRTYGARRVWHDVLADGVSCGLHRDRAADAPAGACGRVRDGGACRRITGERSGERRRAERARPQLRRRRRPTANGSPTSPTSGRPKAGSTSRR